MIADLREGHFRRSEEQEGDSLSVFYVESFFRGQVPSGIVTGRDV